MDGVVYQEHSREVALAIKVFKIVTAAFTLGAIVVGIVFGIIDARAGLFVLDIVTAGFVVVATLLVNIINIYLFILFHIILYYSLFYYLLNTYSFF